jgi:quinol monooxygenase YgiN
MNPLAVLADWSTIPAIMAKRKAKRTASRRPGKKKTSRKSPSGRSVRLSKDALTLIVLLRAREGQETLLEAELRALVGPSRRELGCLRYDLHRSADTPSGFLLHEVWETRDAHTEHTQSPYFLRWNARKDSLLAGRDATFWKQIV